MKCSRCGGMMVYEEFYSQGDNFFGWRCISCGEIVDQVILENRLGLKRYTFSYVPSRLRDALGGEKISLNEIPRISM